MAKISKTYTIEEETLQIVKQNKEERNLSSDSVSLERIVIEWSILKNNVNNSVDIDTIVSRVIEKMNVSNECSVDEVVKEEVKHTDYERSITDVLTDMPE